MLHVSHFKDNISVLRFEEELSGRLGISSISDIPCHAPISLMNIINGIKSGGAPARALWSLTSVEWNCPTHAASIWCSECASVIDVPLPPASPLLTAPAQWQKVPEVSGTNQPRWYLCWTSPFMPVPPHFLHWAALYGHGELWGLSCLLFSKVIYCTHITCISHYLVCLSGMRRGLKWTLNFGLTSTCCIFTCFMLHKLVLGASFRVAVPLYGADCTRTTVVLHEAKEVRPSGQAHVDSSPSFS